MVQLRQGYAEFERRRAVIFVIGPDEARSFARFWQEHRLPFYGLPDPTHRVLRLYGQEMNWLKLGRMPAQVIVDRAGMVRFAHYGSAMSDIPSVEELIQIIDELDREGDP